MKISKRQNTSFQPVTLEITFETEREYKLFKQFLGNTETIAVIEAANISSWHDSIKDFSLDDASIISEIYAKL